MTLGALEGVPLDKVWVGGMVGLVDEGWRRRRGAWMWFSVLGLGRRCAVPMDTSDVPLELPTEGVPVVLVSLVGWGGERRGGPEGIVPCTIEGDGLVLP